LKYPTLFADPGATAAAAAIVSKKNSIGNLVVLGATSAVSDATAMTLVNAWH
jgi:hypothetical protein